MPAFEPELLLGAAWICASYYLVFGAASRMLAFGGSILTASLFRSFAIQCDSWIVSYSTRGTIMTTFSSRAAATAIASLLLLGSALAQTTTPGTPQPGSKATPATKMAPAEKKAEKPRTAVSLQCSKDADAKGLHGKERKKFMSACKKAGADKPK
jgi:psiF repeat